MEKMMMTQEIADNAMKHFKKLHELIQYYELCKLGNEIQEQHIKDVTNRVLRENSFLCGRAVERTGIAIGERITDEKFDFLLSDDDFDRLQRIVTAELSKDGTTDSEGRYVKSWHTMKLHALNDVVDFFIDNIVPVAMRERFRKASEYIMYQYKLLDIAKGMVAA